MNIKKNLRSLSFYFTLFLISQQALALQDEIQVYDDTINAPGIWGIEMHTNTTLSGTPINP
ncbi:MAG: hypothetical protein KGQ44_06900, partial [Betaproteobacteria bacterium]|nr:hypothetical protein [Betaproteobacteria bacterium]